jgi:hypothetical protein
MSASGFTVFGATVLLHASAYVRRTGHSASREPEVVARVDVSGSTVSG